MRNDHVVHWKQAEQLGFTWSAFRAMVVRGELVRVHRSVYRAGAVGAGWRQRLRAAVLATQGVLSHASAAALMGIPSVTQGRPEVTVAHTGVRATDGIRIHRSRVLDACDITTVKGLPCATAPRTIIDLAGRYSRPELLSLIDEAVWGGYCNRQLLHDRAVQIGAGRKGVGHIITATADDADARLRSELERRFARLLRAEGVPRPVVNAPVRVRGRTFIVDSLWEPQMLVVELHGLRFHDTPDALERDATRTNLLTGAGYRVLVFTWRQVIEEPGTVIAMIRRALNNQGGVRYGAITP